MRLFLVDGTYELFRAHYAKRPAVTDVEGADVKATVGVVTFLLSLLTDTDDPIGVAAAFDNPIESFRNARFPAYKDSTGIEPALLAQFDPVEAAVAAVGVTVWSMDHYEADDALATAAVRFAAEGADVRILSPDKDLGQVVGGRVTQVDHGRRRVFDAAGVTARLGVPPTSVPDYLALVGDAADGIPGIAGFGAKTAARLLVAHPHLEDIPLSPDSWPEGIRGAARLAATLRDHLDDALLYRDLATLRTDVPLDADLIDLTWRGVPRERFLLWCDTVGVDLRDRPRRWQDTS